MTSDFLARSIGTNPVVIRRLLASLRRAMLVTSKSAGGGGWMLGRVAEEISLAQIRQAISAGELARMHRNEPHPACAVGKDVRLVLRGVYRRADAALDRELSEITVASILYAVLKEEKTNVAL